MKSARPEPDAGGASGLFLFREILAGFYNKFRQKFAIIQFLYEKIWFGSFVRRRQAMRWRKILTGFSDFNKKLAVADDSKKQTITVEAIFSEHFPICDGACPGHLVGGVLYKF